MISKLAGQLTSPIPLRSLVDNSEAISQLADHQGKNSAMYLFAHLFIFP
jgi:hypothetical protein